MHCWLRCCRTSTGLRSGLCVSTDWQHSSLTPEWLQGYSGRSDHCQDHFDAETTYINIGADPSIMEFLPPHSVATTPPNELLADAAGAAAWHHGFRVGFTWNPGNNRRSWVERQNVGFCGFVWVSAFFLLLLCLEEDCNPGWGDLRSSAPAFDWWWLLRMVTWWHTLFLGDWATGQTAHGAKKCSNCSFSAVTVAL